MTEKLLQFIWQYGYFRKTSLRTVSGDPLHILHPGKRNDHQGPDFGDARLRIGETILAGSVELHLKTSLWQAHGHSADPSYSNVVLHVVYQHDVADPSGLPVLELQPLIPSMLLDHYAQLMNAPSFIPCQQAISSIDGLVWTAWKDRLLAERLIRKGQEVLDVAASVHYHWEDTAWILLARSAGGPVNGEAFEAVARSLPLSLLRRHAHQIHQLEGLLLGQAGLLEGAFEEDYPKLLQREYRHLRKKYGLRTVPHSVLFLRMRPGSFPPLRLAQLAMLVHLNSHLFELLVETETPVALKKALNIVPNDYWLYHYRLDEPSDYKIKHLGEEMTDRIMINAVIPLQFAYGLYHRRDALKSKALNWLNSIRAEDNAVVRGFDGLGVPSGSAFDSQALIELKRNYCGPKRCLECAVGNILLRPSVS